MACEDYPCCGHEPGDCPRIDSKGRQIFRCVGCGRELRVNADRGSSFCTRKDCVKRQRQRMDREYYGDYDY